MNKKMKAAAGALAAVTLLTLLSVRYISAKDETVGESSSLNELVYHAEEKKRMEYYDAQSDVKINGSAYSLEAKGRPFVTASVGGFEFLTTEEDEASCVSLSIDGKEYKLNEYGEDELEKTFVKNGRSSMSYEVMIDSVFARISYEFIRSDYTKASNTIRTRIFISNTDSEELEIGARKMWSFRMTNFYAPPAGYARVEFGSSSFDKTPFCYIYDSIANNKVCVRLDLKSSATSPAKKIVFARSDNIKREDFNYEPDSKEIDINSVLYFYNKLLMPGQSAEFTNIIAIMPTAFAKNEKAAVLLTHGYRLKDKMTATAFAKSIGGDDLADLSFKLNLPDGCAFYKNDAVVKTKIKNKKDSAVNWFVENKEEFVKEGEISFEILSGSSGSAATGSSTYVLFGEKEPLPEKIEEPLPVSNTNEKTNIPPEPAPEPEETVESNTAPEPEAIVETNSNIAPEPVEPAPVDTNTNVEPEPASNVSAETEEKPKTNVAPVVEENEEGVLLEVKDSGIGFVRPKRLFWIKEKTALDRVIKMTFSESLPRVGIKNEKGNVNIMSDDGEEPTFPGNALSPLYVLDIEDERYVLNSHGKDELKRYMYEYEPGEYYWQWQYGGLRLTITHERSSSFRSVYENVMENVVVISNVLAYDSSVAATIRYVFPVNAENIYISEDESASAAYAWDSIIDNKVMLSLPYNEADVSVWEPGYGLSGKYIPGVKESQNDSRPDSIVLSKDIVLEQGQSITLTNKALVPQPVYSEKADIFVLFDAPYFAQDMFNVLAFIRNDDNIVSNITMSLTLPRGIKMAPGTSMEKKLTPMDEEKYGIARWTLVMNSKYSGRDLIKFNLNAMRDDKPISLSAEKEVYVFSNYTPVLKPIDLGLEGELADGINSVLSDYDLNEKELKGLSDYINSSFDDDYEKVMSGVESYLTNATTEETNSGKEDENGGGSIDTNE